MKFILFPAILALLASNASASAQDQSRYFPKFARAEHAAEVMYETCTKPEWPKTSLRNEETGAIILRMTVGTDGNLLNVAVVRSTGFRDLDKATIKALSTCKFRPASINGKPVQEFTMMQFVWTLES